MVKIFRNNIRKFLGGSVHVIPRVFAQKYVEFHTFPISYTEFRGLMPKIPRVSSQGIRKILELFRFPHISTIFDVDFHVDFKRKKIPDEYVIENVPKHYGQNIP